MEEARKKGMWLFGSRLILKIAVGTLVPVAAAAGLAFFWDYREDRKDIEAVIFHEMRDRAVAVASAIEMAGEHGDLRTVVANYLRIIKEEQRTTSGGLRELRLNEILVVDHTGAVLAGSRPELIGRPLAETIGHGPMGLPEVLSGRKSSAAEFTTANGDRLLHISIPLRLDPQAPTGITGAVHLMEPYALLEEALLPGVWRRAAGAFTLALTAVAALTLILGWLVVAPVRRLADAMRQAGEGRNVTVPVTSRDEIGDLTRSFNQMLAELNRKSTTLATLYAIDRTVSQSLDLEVTLAQTLEKICEVMAVEAGGFYLLEADGETLVLRVHRGLSPAFAEAAGRIRMGEGVSGQAIALRRPVAMAMADYPTPRLAQIVLAEGIRHLASAPVIARDRVVGAINVGSHRERPFTAEELDLLGSIGQQIGASVENARLFQQEQARRRQVEAVRATSEEITRELDLATLLRLITRKAAELIGAVSGVAHLWDEAGQVLIPQAWHGFGDWVAELHLRPGEAVAGIVAQRREGMVLNDFRASPYATPVILERTRHTAVVAEPLLYHDRLLGVIVVANDGTERRFSEDDRYILGLFAAQAAIAIENAQLYAATVRQLTEMAALHDMGRAIASSLGLDERLQAILERLVRAAGAQRAMICLVDARDAGRFRQLLGYDSSKPDLWRRHLDLSPKRYPEIQQAMRTRQPLVIPDISAAPLLAPVRHHLEPLDLRSLIVLPLIVQERTIGAVSLGFAGQGRTFADDEIRFCQSMADLSAAAIANGQLFEQVARAKAEWENTFDSIPDLVAVIDAENRLVRVNQAMADRLRTSPDRLVGQRCYEVMHGTDVPWPGCPHAQTLVTGKPATLEVEDPHLGGTFLITTAPLLDAEGRPLGCVHIARDITELKRLEEEARQRHRFEDLSRAKSAFIATMSHELRTPLNAVMGFSDLLLEQKVAPLTEKQARYVGHIHESGKHLLDLINDILDVSRVEADRIELARKPVPLDEAVEATLALARPQAEKAGVALGSEMPPGLPPVLADPVRLRQILFNLLSNAIKFTPTGGLVTVTARQVDSWSGESVDSSKPGHQSTSPPVHTEGPLVEIRVTDTGLGIKPEDIPKLFKEFVQLDAGRAPEKRGTGLGLALTKKLVELHGGRIWVESGGEGRGSTFALVLPFAGPGHAGNLEDDPPGPGPTPAEARP